MRSTNNILKSHNIEKILLPSKEGLRHTKVFVNSYFVFMLEIVCFEQKQRGVLQIHVQVRPRSRLIVMVNKD
jgi:hypothetical protein